MTKTKPKVYPAEFKESAVKLAIESKQPVAQTAAIMCKFIKVSRSGYYEWLTNLECKRTKKIMS